MPKLYLTAGHEIRNGKGTGASSIYGDEAVLAKKLVDDISYKLKSIDVSNDKADWKLASVIQWIKGLATSQDFVIDVHFNAGPITATGTEVIIPDAFTMKELNFATEVSSVIARTLKIRNRGVKKEKDTARKTLGILRIPNKPTNILIEVCFLSNKEDMQSFNQNYSDLVDNLSAVILKNAS